VPFLIVIVLTPPGPTPTFITLESADVIHSFWIPQLAGKTDVIPGKTNRTWVEPRTPGTYVGQCAEFCGVQHAGMLLTVTVHPKDDFARWVAAQQAVAAGWSTSTFSSTGGTTPFYNALQDRNYAIFIRRSFASRGSRAPVSSSPSTSSISTRCS